MPKQIVLEFPVDLPEMILNDKEAFEKGKETIVIKLLRKGEIYHGKAAELLGINRYDIFDRMASHDIPMANFPIEEFERQLKFAKARNEQI
ncbi:MAG: UPF0175 family protein [Deltaproteobacteria bacterium]|nr:UPF0175 family protein [Deltaproteobacteria bacterium]